MRVLALDYGSARCGCALSDRSGTLATPIDPLLKPATPAGFRALEQLVIEAEVEAVVVGLPVTLKGGESAQTAETRRYAQELERLLSVPVHLYDERFTSKLARQSGGATSEHSRAAAHLLDDWLQAQAPAR